MCGTNKLYVLWFSRYFTFKFWWRHNDVIMTSQNFFTYPKPQQIFISSRRVVGLGSISFTFLKIRFTNCSLSIYLCITYKTARVVGRPPSWSHRGADIVDYTIVSLQISCRWTTVPSHLVIALLVWLQWWSKVAISSEKRENFEIFLSPRWIFFSKKIIQNHLKVFFYTF